MLNKAFYIILFLSLSCCVQAQKIMRNTSLLNYQRGDRTVLHFGFSLGINYMDYKAVLSGANGWRAESGKLDVGFLVGIVSELRLGDDWGLRFLPDYSVQITGSETKFIRIETDIPFCLAIGVDQRNEALKNVVLMG